MITRSTDLQRLWDEGHEIQIIGNFAVICQVPYVNAEGSAVGNGKLVCYIHQSGDDILPPPDHVIQWIGDFPRKKDGTLLTALKHPSYNPGPVQPGLHVDHWFSNKPNESFSNYYDKITSYYNIISDQAFSINPELPSKPFELIEWEGVSSPLNYPDTNSSKAFIDPITAKMQGQKIGIIGVGGTGSYILDLLAKTSVAEIHLFDGDRFLQHNAFKAPGATRKDRFSEHLYKVNYLAEIYRAMHSGIYPHQEYLNKDNIELLKGLQFVFIAMDTNPSKKIIIDFLESQDISFVDVGMELNEAEGEIVGQLRVTVNTPTKRDHYKSRATMVQQEDNIYNRNIQIADLNALNAAFAVIKWKKLIGFYQDKEKEYDSMYAININELYNNDHSA